MSYSDSVRRAENKKMFLLLSKDSCYYESENEKFDFISFGDEEYLPTLVLEVPKITSSNWFKPSIVTLPEEERYALASFALQKASSFWPWKPGELNLTSSSHETSEANNINRGNILFIFLIIIWQK